MAFEDLKDKLSEEWAATYARLQENSTFIQLQERFYALPPIGQKVVTVAGILCGVMFAFWIPWGIYSSSEEKIAEFERQKTLIQDMFRAKRDSSMIVGDQRRISPEELSSMIQGRIGAIRLSPEQNKGVQPYTNSTQPSAAIPKGIEQTGASVTIAKLNLQQIVDVAYSLQTLSTSVKMIGMDILAAADDARYFDVTFKMVNFSPPEAKEAPAAGGNRSAPKPKKNKEDE